MLECKPADTPMEPNLKLAEQEGSPHVDKERYQRLLTNFCVTDYYHTLTRYWQQLDIYEDIVWTCPEDSKQYKKLVEKDRIYQFLLGLTKHLDDVRGRILGTKPLPNIREVFSEVRREESRRKVMLGSTYQSSINEGSALAVKGSYKKSRGWCDQCKKSGHNKETCWVIHGKPADWKPSRYRDIRVHAATSEGGKVLAAPALEPSPFSKEQMEMLQKLLQQSLQNTSTHSAAALDMDSGRKIGNAEECAGLYFLQASEFKEKRNNSVYVAASSGENLEEVVMLWHYRLGHPNFMYLEKMFPSLFNKNSNLFQCGIYQLSKHSHKHYPPQSYKPSQPFSLIHNDIWGPSRVKNITGSKWFVTFIDDHTRVTWVFLMKEKSVG
ncbi:uncharacterized protein [Cicer arietinum]|uniref:uncharacterized protein n=1 Tax=Cicer arietinum TaxID=3827 RepID=UPI003CC5A971